MVMKGGGRGVVLLSSGGGGVCGTVRGAQVHVCFQHFSKCCHFQGTPSL